MATKKDVRKAALKEMLSKHSKMSKESSHKGMMDGMMAKMKGKQSFMAKVGTSVSSVLRTRMPSFKKAPSSKFPALKTVKMPKNTVSALAKGLLSSKTLRGTVVKVKKPSVKVSSVQASLKSLISKSKKIKPSAMAHPSSAPAVPSPAFFGRPNISGM